nr:hypothetical protein CKG001_02130 [Bdellovibrio sp. CKG001]
MNYTDFKRHIYGSSASDWLYDDDKGIYTFKNDLNITIRADRSDIDRSFTEPWHQGLPDPTAYRTIYELYYGSSYVDYELVVNVDGGRASIPLPEEGYGNPWITTDQKAFGEIIDRLNTLSEYLRRCNVSVR